jgi:hypothetical protein
MIKDILLYVAGLAMLCYVALAAQRALPRAREEAGELTAGKVLKVVFGYQLIPFLLFELVGLIVFQRWTLNFIVAFFIPPVLFLAIVIGIAVSLGTHHDHRDLLPYLADYFQPWKSLRDGADQAGTGGRMSNNSLGQVQPTAEYAHSVLASARGVILRDHGSGKDPKE